MKNVRNKISNTPKYILGIRIPPNVKKQSKAKKNHKNHKNHIVVVQNVGMCKAYPTFGKTSSIFHIFHSYPTSKLTFLGQNSNCYLGANVGRGATHAHIDGSTMMQS
jgi:hypothetical protein